MKRVQNQLYTIAGIFAVSLILGGTVFFIITSLI